MEPQKLISIDDDSSEEIDVVGIEENQLDSAVLPQLGAPANYTYRNVVTYSSPYSYVCCPCRYPAVEHAFYQQQLSLQTAMRSQRTVFSGAQSYINYYEGYTSMMSMHTKMAFVGIPNERYQRPFAREWHSFPQYYSMPAMHYRAEPGRGYFTSTQSRSISLEKAVHDEPEVLSEASSLQETSVSNISQCERHKTETNVETELLLPGVPPDAISTSTSKASNEENVEKCTSPDSSKFKLDNISPTLSSQIDNMSHESGAPKVDLGLELEDWESKFLEQVIDLEELDLANGLAEFDAFSIDSLLENTLNDAESEGD